MYEPAWKRLVEQLKERGFESRYLDRLWDRLGPAAQAVAAGNGYETLQREIMEEMAYALRQAQEKTDLAMLMVELAATAVLENEDPADTNMLAEKYETHRRAAMRARWEFMVHREAIGLLEHRVLEELYPIPPSYRQLIASAAATSRETEEAQ